MDEGLKTNVGAIVLAAGLSTRMGKPKMLLPWDEKPIIRHVIEILLTTGLQHIVIVTGGYKELIDPLLSDTPVVNVFNSEFSNGEMLNSVQVGLKALPDSIQTAFLVLGDQPTITSGIFSTLLETISPRDPKIIIPSYHFRRGHPWVIHRYFWQQIMDLTPTQTLRNFLSNNENFIQYVEFTSPEILQDLDTPQDYEKFKPRKKRP